MQLILASTSVYRRAQLQQIGTVFDAVAPPFDEEAAKDLSLSPVELAESLAMGKARSLIATYPQAAILGGDQLVDFDGKIIGKAGSKAAAVDQLVAMSGKMHRLMTSIYLYTPQKIYQHTDIAEMTMRALSREQLDAYVEQDNPIDCAGSYKLECAGMGLFESINSSDFSAIQGLPLLTLNRWFAELRLASTAFGRF